MRIAMFGGSFNPVHSGHVELASAVHETAGYDRVVFVPAFHSPFKNMPEGATDADRLEMLRLALSPFDWAEIEECEINRGGVSYTYDTVCYLQEKYRSMGILEGKLGLVIGADLAENFYRWHKAGEIAEMADIVLARRCGEDGSRKVPSFDFPHLSLENPYHDVSSSEVRQCSGDRAKLAALVPEKVCGYIVDRGLYGKGIR